MKLILPNGEKIYLENNISLDEKIKRVDFLIVEWEDVILKNWLNDNIKIFLDNLSNYLVWHKEENEKNKSEKEVLSIYKVEKMSGKRKSKEIPFTSLSSGEKEMLFGDSRGVEDV